MPDEEKLRIDVRRANAVYKRAMADAENAPPDNCESAHAALKAAIQRYEAAIEVYLLAKRSESA